MINVLKNLPFLFAIPLFFCVHHYNGIIIDATLYITQYVHSIDPSRFLQDPAFEFGSQGNFGCFSRFFGLFLESFGVDGGAFVYTFLMQLLWIVLAVFLIRVLIQHLQNRLWMLPITILFVGIFAHGMQFSLSFFYSDLNIGANLTSVYIFSCPSSSSSFFFLSIIISILVGRFLTPFFQISLLSSGSILTSFVSIFLLTNSLMTLTARGAFFLN